MMLIGVQPHVAVATAVFGMMMNKIAGVFSISFWGKSF
jgi:hypothetical protein